MGAGTMLDRRSGAILPSVHAERVPLNDEVHARPPDDLLAPCRLSYLALYSGGLTKEEQWAPVEAFAARFNCDPPERNSNHYRVDLGQFRLRWELHTEFARYTIVQPEAPAGDLFNRTAIELLPADWVASLPGEVLVASHAALLTEGLGDWDIEAISQRYFDGNPLVGSAIAGGAGSAITDFRIHRDGFSRILAENRGMNRWQAGRLMQRLFEIDTYRMLALLTLPVARGLGPFLVETEADLVEISKAMETGGADEPALLDKLTRLQAAMETRHSETDYRFSAAQAYYDLVRQRIDELREERIQGLQTMREFMQRRLAPAMSTCATIAHRQDSLSERVARTTQLLSTRVEVSRAEQNQEILHSMDRRVEMQVRLQETVEGLSIAAISYYVVGLVGYLVKGVAAAGVAFNPDLVIGIAIPIVVTAVALGVRSVRKSLPGPPPETWRS